VGGKLHSVQIYRVDLTAKTFEEIPFEDLREGDRFFYQQVGGQLYRCVSNPERVPLVGEEWTWTIRAEAATEQPKALYRRAGT